MNINSLVCVCICALQSKQFYDDYYNENQYIYATRMAFEMSETRTFFCLKYTFSYSKTTE